MKPVVHAGYYVSVNAYSDFDRRNTARTVPANQERMPTAKSLSPYKEIEAELAVKHAIKTEFAAYVRGNGAQALLRQVECFLEASFTGRRAKGAKKPLKSPRKHAIPPLGSGAKNQLLEAAWQFTKTEQTTDERPIVASNGSAIVAYNEHSHLVIAGDFGGSQSEPIRYDSKGEVIGPLHTRVFVDEILASPKQTETAPHWLSTGELCARVLPAMNLVEDGEDAVASLCDNGEDKLGIAVDHAGIEYRSGGGDAWALLNLFTLRRAALAFRHLAEEQVTAYATDSHSGRPYVCFRSPKVLIRVEQRAAPPSRPLPSPIFVRQDFREKYIDVLRDVLKPHMTLLQIEEWLSSSLKNAEANCAGGANLRRRNPERPNFIWEPVSPTLFPL